MHAPWGHAVPLPAAQQPRCLQPAPVRCAARPTSCRCQAVNPSHDGDASSAAPKQQQRARRSSSSRTSSSAAGHAASSPAGQGAAASGRRRRRTTAATSPQSARQAAAPPDSAAAAERAASAPAAERATRTDDAAAAAAAAPVIAASVRRPRSGRNQPATPTQRTPKQQQASTLPPPPQQQEQPPNIEYALNSAVASYTDPNTCTVYWDEPRAGGGSSSNGGGGSNGGGNGGSVSGMSGSYSESQCDAVRGLIYGATVRFSDSAALRLRRRAMVVWEESGPQRVLIVKKPVPQASATLRDMATWLQRHGLQVFVERSVHATEFPELEAFDPATTQVDFAITLGGDGTVLHLASLFAEDAPLPPVMCFAMGTLGFLTPFDAAQFRSCLARVLAANRKPLFCTLRTRKRCAVLDADGQVRRVHHILNECVVDRGAFPSSVYLEVYVDGMFVTAAEADGLIIATPSGSTAYSMSAGGSMVAPSVPCTLITPLSPHSLSFRPLIVPENAALCVRLPANARSHARASFDGKHPMRIARGQSVHFQTSLCPLPLINIGAYDSDWYEGITRKLKWNQSIRGVPAALDSALLQQAAAAAAAAAPGPPSALASAAGDVGPPALAPQLSLGGLVSSLASAAANEAKVAGWVEEALLSHDGPGPRPGDGGS